MPIDWKSGHLSLLEPSGLAQSYTGIAQSYTGIAQSYTGIAQSYTGIALLLPNPLTTYDLISSYFVTLHVRVSSYKPSALIFFTRIPPLRY